MEIIISLSMFLTGFLFGFWAKGFWLTKTKLPEINKIISYIGEGINVSQGNPDCVNPYTTVKGPDSIEAAAFEIGKQAGNIFHNNMRAFENRYKACVLDGFEGKEPKPAVPWLAECYDAGAELKERIPAYVGKKK